MFSNLDMKICRWDKVIRSPDNATIQNYLLHSCWSYVGGIFLVEIVALSWYSLATSSTDFSTRTSSQPILVCWCCYWWSKKLRHSFVQQLFFFFKYVLGAIPSCLYNLHKYPAVLKSLTYQVYLWLKKSDHSGSPSFCWSTVILLHYSVLELFSKHTYITVWTRHVIAL